MKGRKNRRICDLGYFSELLNNPAQTLMVLLLALPGRLMAISAHEFAHAWVADRCGDPTARNLGRLTMNPLKHLDLLGTLMMVLIGFGWAKPVPVNPRNYRNYRRDDLKVSLAGIVMNLILFLLGCALLYAAVGAALKSAGSNTFADVCYLTPYRGETVFVNDGSYLPVSALLKDAPYLSDYLIKPMFGEIPGYIYTMVMYFTLTNLVLAVFNLIPVPPLDGYHVLNDTLLRRRQLFVSPRTAQIAMGVLYILMFTGVTGYLISQVRDVAFSGIGSLAGTIFHALGIL